MTNWRIYKITSKTTHSGYIEFQLDGYVNFKDGETRTRIDCKDTYPWNGYYSGDYLEIDLDETVRWGPARDFISTSEVRKASSSLVAYSSNQQRIGGQMQRWADQSGGSYEVANINREEYRENGSVSARETGWVYRPVRK